VQIAKSKYFTVFAPAGMTIPSLLIQLKNTLILEPTLSDSPQTSLEKILDTMYQKISDILGIHIYDPTQFQVKINIHDNPVKAKYFPQDKEINVTSSSLMLYMLAHEIAHALLCHYFVTTPSEQIQEIICGYVDYKFRKEYP
jgi:hypothetical protein